MLLDFNASQFLFIWTTCADFYKIPDRPKYWIWTKTIENVSYFNKSYFSFYCSFSFANYWNFNKKWWRKNIQSGQKALKMIWISIVFQMIFIVFFLDIYFDWIRNWQQRFYMIWTKTIENCSYPQLAFSSCESKAAANKSIANSGAGRWSNRQQFAIQLLFGLDVRYSAFCCYLRH